MRTPHRRIRGKLESGGRALGVTLQLPCPDIAEIAGYAGFDFVWIDAEHGTFDLGRISEMVRAADASGIDAIVRVPDHNPSFIQRVLDTGASGIIVPHICTVAEATAVAAAARFGPAGTRGACPSTRSVGHLTSDWSASARQADADVLVAGLIEDLAGVENVEEIARVSGLDALLFGPFDLAQQLGFDGDVTHPEIEAMHDRVVAAARAAGIEYLSIPAWEYADLATVAEYSRILALTGDRGGLFTTFRTTLAETIEALAGLRAGAAT